MAKGRSADALRAALQDVPGSARRRRWSPSRSGKNALLIGDRAPVLDRSPPALLARPCSHAQLAPSTCSILPDRQRMALRGRCFTIWRGATHPDATFRRGPKRLLEVAQLARSASRRRASVGDALAPHPGSRACSTRTHRHRRAGGPARSASSARRPPARPHCLARAPPRIERRRRVRSWTCSTNGAAVDPNRRLRHRGPSCRRRRSPTSPPSTAPPASDLVAPEPLAHGDARRTHHRHARARPAPRHKAR